MFQRLSTIFQFQSISLQELFKQVEDFYADNFPLDVRLNLSAWIEEKFHPSLTGGTSIDDAIFVDSL